MEHTTEKDHQHPGDQTAEYQNEHAGHGHTHGAVDPSLFSSQRGIWAVKWSLAGLFATAMLQVVIVYFTGSVALLADTIHNFGDALTAVPLWVAFRLMQRPPTRRFTYGFGRVEDLAGLAVVVMIAVSAVLAGYEALQRFFEPQPVRYLWAVVGAAVIGFLGNEAVALFRIKIGKEIGSAALVADGYHARVDGLTSLAVLAGAVGVALGYPVADPLVGLLITVAIVKILWDTSKSVFTRLLDGVDPEVVSEIEHAATHVPGVEGVNDLRVRWLGHRLTTQLSITVDPELSVAQAHDLACQVEHELLHHLDYLSEASVHIDPIEKAGDIHHRIENHSHDDYGAHSH